MGEDAVSAVRAELRAGVEAHEATSENRDQTTAHLYCKREALRTLRLEHSALRKTYSAVISRRDTLRDEVARLVSSLHAARDELRNFEELPVALS